MCVWRARERQGDVVLLAVAVFQAVYNVYAIEKEGGRKGGWGLRAERERGLVVSKATLPCPHQRCPILIHPLFPSVLPARMVVVVVVVGCGGRGGAQALGAHGASRLGPESRMKVRVY
jgi:hypothetical protein